MKKTKIMNLLTICSMVGMLSACNNSKEAINNIASPQTTSDMGVVLENSSTESVEYNEENKMTQYNNTVDMEDTMDKEIGLLTTKIDQNGELSDEQKMVIQYFDDDYFEVADYEFLQRYPQVFEGSQIHCVAEVVKILSATDEEYKALAMIFDFKSYGDGHGAIDPDYTNENYIVVKGKQQGIKRVIEGDVLQIYGRYVSIDSYNINGKDYMLPALNLYDNSYINDRGRFSPEFIKKVAKVVFGPNIEVRNAVAGEDYTGTELSWKFGYDPYMICELENQTNAKFTKFRFYTERGMIDDAKGASSEPMLDLITTNIVRKIEFAPDLQHYLLFTYDTDLNTLSLDYYDIKFNKMWNREFKETTNSVYDYTSKAIYLVANNDLYIIDLKDGRDLFEPSFVGEKSRVSKVKDGLLLIANSTNDTVMKIGLDGDIIWKANTKQEPYNIAGIQHLNNYLVIATSNFWNFIIIDETDGTLVAEL